MSPAGERVAALVRRHGPLPADVVIDEALYGEHGFYAGGGGAGRGADFLTSPEVGPLFGALVAEGLDRWWSGLDQPDPFVVVEAGAGSGALCRSVLAARPACGPALRYVCVERAPAQRARIDAALTVEPATQVLGGPKGRGPVVAIVDDLPAGPVIGVVLANELLDNLPPALVERRAEGWVEVRVGLDGDRLVEVPGGPVDVRWAPSAPEGARLPLVRSAQRWVQRAAGLLEAGHVVAFDYGVETSDELAARPMADWLRTYRGHRRGRGWLEDLGEQDVTCEVPADQLRPDAVATQAARLADLGLERRAEDARQAWQAGAARGDLAALAARSTASEAAALADPDGLGGFLVLEWAVGVSPSWPPPRAPRR